MPSTFLASLVLLYATVSLVVATCKETMAKIKLGKRSLDNLPQITKHTTFFDTELTGFGIRVSPSGARSWIVEYRPGIGGRGVAKRRLVLGAPKTLTPSQARTQAAAPLAQVKLGADPAQERSEASKADSVSDLLTSFMDDHIRVKRKARTAKLFDGYIKNHLEPALGARRAPALLRIDVERLHKTIGKTNPVTASRVIALISAVYAYGLRADLPPKETSANTLCLRASNGKAMKRRDFIVLLGRHSYDVAMRLARIGELVRALADAVSNGGRPCLHSSAVPAAHSIRRVTFLRFSAPSVRTSASTFHPRASRGQ